MSRDTSLIGLDCTYALDEQPTGVGVYCAEMLRGLPTHAPPECRFRFFARPHRLSRLIQREGIRQARPLFDSTPRGLHLFHGLNQRLPRRKRAPSVCTFHDLFVLTGEYSTREFRERFAAQAREAARDADLIIAVSAFTASQIEDLLAIPASRIRVVPHGVNLPASIASAGQREPIILHVGAIQKRKNLVTLVEAFTRAAPAGWQLHLVGGDGYESAPVHEAIARSSRVTDIVKHGYVAAAQLDSLYQRASIFAFPSWAEGFGIPILEAMAAGIPVLSSNQSALPEAAGTAARLLDPADVDTWSANLRELCENPSLRLEMSDAGRLHASELTWRRAVDSTLAVYQELL